MKTIAAFLLVLAPMLAIADESAQQCVVYADLMRLVAEARDDGVAFSDVADALEDGGASTDTVAIAARIYAAPDVPPVVVENSVLAACLGAEVI